MKFSVIIPVYNSEHSIISALESIRNQTLSPFDILITNDGSTDNTKVLIKKYAENFPYLPISVISQKNRGIGAARNAGLSQAKGDFIAFLDADDLWYPTKLERVQNIFRKYPKIDIVYHAIMEVSHSKSKRIIRYRPISGYAYKFLLFYGNQLATSATVVKKSVLLHENGFSEDMAFNSAEDYDLWLRLARKWALFYYLDEVMTEYHRSPFSITDKLDYHGNSIYNVYTKHLNCLFKSGYIDENDYENYLFYQSQIRNHKVIKHFLRFSDYISLKKYLITLLKQLPLKLKRLLFMIYLLKRNRKLIEKL